MKNQRKIYLINPPFQIRISIYISLIILFSSLIYPLTIYEIMDTVIINISKILPGMAESLSNNRSSLLITLTLWQIGFTALMFIICIFVTHRIAGPIYKMTMIFKKITNGEEELKPVTFRKGDYFPELASEYSHLVGKITSDISYNKDQLEAAISKIVTLQQTQTEENKILITEIIESLKLLKNK